MAEVTAADVAKLRKATGAGMMDCKNALEATDGELEAAMDWLREKGLGKAGKLSDREATEGAVEAVVEGNVGALVELRCNTDFVAKSADFKELVAAIARAVVAEGDADVASLAVNGSTVGDTVTQMAATLGENVSLGRVVRFEASDGLVDAYKHIQSDRGTIGVLVELGGVDAASDEARAVAHEIALHVSFAAPEYLTRDEVPADVIEREREVLEAKSRNEGVPEAKLAGAVTGRLNGFYKEVVLVDQPSVKDPKVSIGKLVEGLGGGASVRRFARVKAGEE
ncbi:MAG TPA: translation elongation factor Ts [Acidimicrobiia bacterium]|nr:translation elongation factor Ts [Acidimicrobiia bacterium]